MPLRQLPPSRSGMRRATTLLVWYQFRGRTAGGGTLQESGRSLSVRLFFLNTCVIAARINQKTVGFASPTR
jgi:hypothetical protein